MEIYGYLVVMETSEQTGTMQNLHCTLNKIIETVSPAEFKDDEFDIHFMTEN